MANYTAQVAESPVAVAVVVLPVPSRSEPGTDVCSGEGYSRQVTVTLAAALAGRVMIDNAGVAITVTS
jgi:hypothetical protein